MLGTSMLHLTTIHNLSECVQFNSFQTAGESIVKFSGID